MARMLDLGPQINEWLDRYVDEWRFVKPHFTGDDLRRAGLPPGPVYAKILDQLLMARLDGLVTSQDEECQLFESLVADAA